MAKYTIQPVSTGTFAEAETSLLYYLADDRNAGVKISAVYWMFLVCGEGGIILVDTGPGEPAAGKRIHHDYDRTPDQEPVAALHRLGIAPDDVDVVINTHLHRDHCHGNDLFPNAVIRVQACEIIEAMHPVPAHRGFYTPLSADPPWVRAIQKTVPVNGDTEIVQGVRVLTMPSHTVGFQVVLVDTHSGPIIIAGDMLPYFDNWTGRWGLEHIPVGHFRSQPAGVLRMLRAHQANRPGRHPSGCRSAHCREQSTAENPIAEREPKNLRDARSGTKAEPEARAWGRLAADVQRPMLRATLGLVRTLAIRAPCLTGELKKWRLQLPALWPATDPWTRPFVS